MDPGSDPVTSRFEALRERLLGTAYFVIGHREDAREAVQDAFVKCWRNRRKAADARDLEAWIFSVLLNTARDIRRRRRVRHAEPLAPEDVMPNPGEDPVRRASAREELDRVRSAIHRLPDAEREVFLLRQNGDLTYEGIAATLGCPVGTAKTRMRSALRRLRQAMEPVGRPRGGAA
jgi:RNA polymerase sigma-70 factor (ECF subfamily)